MRPFPRIALRLGGILLILKMEGEKNIKEPEYLFFCNKRLNMKGTILIIIVILCNGHG